MDEEGFEGSPWAPPEVEAGTAPSVGSQDPAVVPTPSTYDPMDEVLRAAGVPDVALDATMAAEPSEPEPTTRRRRSWWKLAVATVASLAVVGGLTAWALTERSSANEWQSRSRSWQARAGELDAQLHTTTKQLSDSQATVRSQASRISDLASEKAQVTDERQQLQQIVQTVPSVTGGLRQCASAALQVGSDLADFITAFPYGSTYGLTADIDNETSVCTSADSAADTLDAIIDGIHN